jgi:hypothetical protein
MQKLIKPTPEMKQVYYDIEAISDNETFPNAHIQADKIIQICCVLVKGEKIIKKRAFVLGRKFDFVSNDNITKIFFYDTES